MADGALTSLDSPGKGKRNLRILFVSNLFPDSAQPYRGLDNATVLHALREHHSCEVRVLSPRPALPSISKWACPKPRPGDEVLRPQYCRALYVPWIGSRFNHHLMRRSLEAPLRRIRDEFPWDIVLASWLYPDGWAVARLAAEFQTPCVLIAQGSDVHTYLRKAPRRRRILEGVQASKAVITRSKSLAKLLELAGADGSKLFPIFNGIDTKVFHPGDRDLVRQELGIEYGTKVLLFVGNLLPVKDPLMLLRAFHTLRETLPTNHLKLVIAGKGPLRQEAESLCNALGTSSDVTFAGPLDSAGVARWMQAADLLCMTSRNEGLPNVILEAQACGLCVVSTDVGGIHEVVDSPGKGSLVPVGDVHGWVRAAANLIASPPPRELIAAAGQRRNWRSAAEQYWEVLGNALKSG